MQLHTRRLPQTSSGTRENVNEELKNAPIDIQMQGESFQFYGIDENGLKIRRLDSSGDEIPIEFVRDARLISKVSITRPLAVPQNVNYSTVLSSPGGGNLTRYIKGIPLGPLRLGSGYGIDFSDNFLSTLGRITFGVLGQKTFRTLDDLNRFLLKPSEEIFITLLEGTALDAAEDEAPVLKDLLQNVPSDFPFIEVNALNFNETDKRVELFLSRKSENAPSPSPLFFHIFRVGNRGFNFSSARYNALAKEDEENPFAGRKVSKYSWSAQEDPTQGRTKLDLVFEKIGTSITNYRDDERLIQKSTVRTEEKKEFDSFINGFEVRDFDFDQDFFQISFAGQIPATDFLALRIKDKEGKMLITRDLVPADAVRTEEDHGVTTFHWQGFEEFKNLMRNKKYTLEIVREDSTSTTENRFFIPRPSKESTIYPLSVGVDGNEFNLSFLPNSANKTLNIRAVGIRKSSDSSFLMEETAITRAIRNGFDFIFPQSNPIDVGVAGQDFELLLTVEDYSPFVLDFLKLTDLFFDTIVILDTNIDDISLKDIGGRELIHPSDVESFEAIEENGKRNVVLFLKNPITAPNVDLEVRRIDKDHHEVELSRILMLKKIGQFSKYPKIKPLITKTRTITPSQAGKSHVVTRVPARNYVMTFPPLEKDEDALLADDLFNRSADNSEFIVWPAGGRQTIKNKGLTGFAFKDLVKSLCGNDFEYMYVDGRFSSGVDFTMETVEVP